LCQARRECDEESGQGDDSFHPDFLYRTGRKQIDHPGDGCVRENGGSIITAGPVTEEGAMLKIWGRASSSNVQKVLWCCAELDLPFERVDVGGTFGGNR